MAVKAFCWKNAGLNDQAANFARGIVVELIGRFHADVCQQIRLISPNIDLNIKIMPSPNNFECKSAAPAANAAQANFKRVDQSVNLIIHTKQLTSNERMAQMKLLQLLNIRHYLSRVKMMHLTIPANQTSINLENNFTGALPDLVIVGLMWDDDLAGGYQ